MWSRFGTCALELLEFAVDHGMYPYRFFRDFSQFMQPLRGLPEFDRIVAKAERRAAEFDAMAKQKILGQNKMAEDDPLVVLIERIVRALASQSDLGDPDRGRLSSQSVCESAPSMKVCSPTRTNPYFV